MRIAKNIQQKRKKETHRQSTTHMWQRTAHSQLERRSCFLQALYKRCPTRHLGALVSKGIMHQHLPELPIADSYMSSMRVPATSSLLLYSFNSAYWSTNASPGELSVNLQRLRNNQPPIMYPEQTPKNTETPASSLGCYLLYTLSCLSKAM